MKGRAPLSPTSGDGTAVSSSARQGRAPEEVTIGFGCLWNRSRARTWSHTPASLLEAIQRTGPCVDLGYESRWQRLLRLRYLRRRDGRLQSSWRYQIPTLDTAAAARSPRRSGSRQQGTHPYPTALRISCLRDTRQRVYGRRRGCDAG